MYIKIIPVKAKLFISLIGGLCCIFKEHIFHLHMYNNFQHYDVTKPGTVNSRLKTKTIG